VEEGCEARWEGHCYEIDFLTRILVCVERAREKAFEGV